MTELTGLKAIDPQPSAETLRLHSNPFGYKQESIDRYEESLDGAIGPGDTKRMKVLLEPEELSPEAMQELNRMVERLKEIAMTPTRLTGEEYQTTEGSDYRGDSLGVVVATIYTQIYGLLRPRKGVCSFVEEQKMVALGYANGRGGNNPTALLKYSKFQIPIGGPVLLEFKPVTGNRGYETGGRTHGYLRDFLSLAKLTDPCKRYILDILGLDENSYAYKILYECT